ncbi:hypothetical protein Unana1_01512 [Umbelopsis nana]
MPNHITEEFSPLNNAFAVNDPSVTKFIPNRLIPGRLLEPNLLYRHDHNTIEVRFVNGCQQSVCGTLTANDFSRMLERTVEIVAVSSFILGDRQYLAIILREMVAKDTYVVPWDASANKWELIELSSTVEGTVNAVAMSSHGFLSPNESIDEISHGLHHLMVLGTDTSALHLIDISSVDGTFKIRSEVTQIQAPGSGIRTLHILLSTMTNKHAMDPKIYVGGDDRFLNVFKYKVVDGKQFIIPSRNLTELLPVEDPVTHIECFRLQDQQKTIVIVGQSPTEHSNSQNKARITVIQTLTNSTRTILGTFEASNLQRKKAKHSSVLAIRSVAPVDLNGSHYLLAAFSAKSQSSTSTELLACRVNQNDVQEVSRKDISDYCYGVTLQDLFPARGVKQSLLLFPNKIVQYNGLFDAQPLPQADNIESSASFSSVDLWFHLDDKAFKSCYNAKEVKSIQKQRKGMHGELFLDKLLKFAGINATSYPPKSNGDLQKLYKAIEECDLDILRKHSLVYYLLLDWKNASQARYARRYLIPSQFQKLMDGYWAMDHGQYEDGVKSLADPGVEADWTDKVLQTLYDLSNHRLALQYATISKHHSEITDDIILRMKIFAKCDIVRAFYFQANENQEAVVERALSFPLNPHEEQIFVAYLANSPQPATKVCLMHYYVAHDCQMQALELNERIQSQQFDHERTSMAVSQHSKYVVSKLCNSLPPLLSNVASRWQIYGDSNPAMVYASDTRKASPQIAYTAKNGGAAARDGANLGKEIFVSVFNTHSKKRKMDSDIVMTDG